MISTSPLADGLYYYTCITLIDITKTDAVRHYIDGIPELRSEYELMRNQQRNWQTILQVISLRVQPMHISVPIIATNQTLTQFGTLFATGTVWAFTFGVEQEAVFDLPDSPNKVLLNDLHNVPVVVNLKEDVTISPAIIDTNSSATKNTIILR